MENIVFQQFVGMFTAPLPRNDRPTVARFQGCSASDDYGDDTNHIGFHSFRFVNGVLSTGDWDPGLPVPRQLSQGGSQVDVILGMHAHRYGRNDVIRSESQPRILEP